MIHLIGVMEAESLRLLLHLGSVGQDAPYGFVPENLDVEYVSVGYHQSSISKALDFGSTTSSSGDTATLPSR